MHEPFRPGHRLHNEFSKRERGYDAKPVCINHLQPLAHGDGIGIFRSRGIAGFYNTFGVAISNAAVTHPTTLTNRWILVPNTKSVITGASTQPSEGTNFVTGGYCIPVLNIAAPADGTISGNDGHGTQIATYDSQTYTGDPVYLYPFILPNARKYNASAESGQKWYVDTSVEPATMVVYFVMKPLSRYKLQSCCV